VAPSSSASPAEFLFEVGGLGPEVLRVVHFRGTEGISQLFEFEIELAADDASIEFDAVVGEAALLTWKGAAGDRRVHGIVSRFEQTGRGRSHAYYTARLVPKVWTLGLRHGSRIFQKKSTPEVLFKVLEGAGIPTDMFRKDLERKYKPRNFCVQYRESDFDFISRLMEEEGIYYFFEQTEKGHVMVIADHAAATVAIEDDSEIPFTRGWSGLEGVEQVALFRCAKRITPGAVTLIDFDFKKPSLSLKGGVRGNVDGEHEWYDYPAAVPDVSMAGDVARVRLEQHRAERELAGGDGNCRRFLAGYRFTLDGHPRAELNGEFLIVRVRHVGRQPQAGEEDAVGAGEPLPTYRNAFDCVPSSTPWRSQRLTPLPRVRGPQTAIVVGPPGEEIHVDEHGRVKVRFLWDRVGADDDTASSWVRVSQGSCGSGWGQMFIPRVGNEVIVEFLEGDPNRPIITGRCFNAASMPPYALPDEKTMSTFQSQTSPGGGSSNELRMQDSNGGMEFFIHASKNMTVDVKNNFSEEVAVNAKHDVGIDLSLDVEVDETIGIGGDRTVTIGSNDKLRVRGSQTTDVTGSQTITIGSVKNEAVVTGAMTDNVTGSKTLDVGAASVRLVFKNSSETVTGSKTSTFGGLDLKVIRSDDGVEVGGKRSLKVGGAYLMKIGGALVQEVKGTLMSIAAGALIAKSANTTVKAEDLLTLVAGASIITMTPSSITIAGTSVKVDAESAQKGSSVGFD